MKWILYILIAATAFTDLANGFGLFAESGRTGQYLGGTVSTVAILYLIGGLIIIPGLIGLVMGKDWGKVVGIVGIAMGFLAAVLTMTVGTIPVLQVLLPLISIILLFVIKK